MGEHQFIGHAAEDGGKPPGLMGGGFGSAASGAVNFSSPNGMMI